MQYLTVLLLAATATAASVRIPGIGGIKTQPWLRPYPRVNVPEGCQKPPKVRVPIPVGMCPSLDCSEEACMGGVFQEVACDCPLVQPEWGCPRCCDGAMQFTHPDSCAADSTPKI